MFSQNFELSKNKTFNQKFELLKNKVPYAEIRDKIDWMKKVFGEMGNWGKSIHFGILNEMYYNKISLIEKEEKKWVRKYIETNVTEGNCNYKMYYNGEHLDIRIEDLIFNIDWTIRQDLLDDYYIQMPDSEITAEALRKGKISETRMMTIGTAIISNLQTKNSIRIDGMRDSEVMIAAISTGILTHIKSGIPINKEILRLEDERGVKRYMNESVLENFNSLSQTECKEYENRIFRLYRDLNSDDEDVIESIRIMRFFENYNYHFDRNMNEMQIRDFVAPKIIHYASLRLENIFYEMLINGNFIIVFEFLNKNNYFKDF